MLKPNLKLYFDQLVCCLGLLFFLTAVMASPSYAQFSDTSVKIDVSELELETDTSLSTYEFTGPIDTPLSFSLNVDVADRKEGAEYSGMAVYLGFANVVAISDNNQAKVLKLKKDESVIVEDAWVGFKGRFKSRLMQSDTGAFKVTKDRIVVSWPPGVIPDLKIITGSHDSDTRIAPELPDIRKLQYVHLPKWMRLLCNIVERIYKTIQKVTGLGWGLSLILFAIVMKVLLLPLTMLTAKSQNKANKHKAALEPIFADIKKHYKGEVAHKKVMAAYKARGITPYYSLKPLMATMISLPVLIAIFNMLGEIAVLQQAKFLWIDSLAYPDKIGILPVKLLLFGNSLNLLPFLMTGVTLLSASLLKSDTASPTELKRQKRNLVLMGAVFFLIFYPFPSAMVLYWTLSTALQLVANKFIKKNGKDNHGEVAGS